VVLLNGTLWSKKSGSIKECTQTSIEMCTGCQRNVYWRASASWWLVQPIKELSSAAGRCAGRGFELIRQLANYTGKTSWLNYQK